MTDSETIQRRNFFRFPIDFEIHYVPVELPVEFETDAILRDKTLRHWEKTPEDHFQTARTVNIGGGGLQILMIEKITAGKTIYVELPQETLPIRAAARLIRTIRTGIDAKYPFRAALTFLALTDTQQSEIVRFVLHEQQRRQKHLLG